MANPKTDAQGITLGPCQVCNNFKQKFYLCDRGHATCDDCKRIKPTATPQANSSDDRKASVSTPPRSNLNLLAMSPNHPSSSCSRASTSRCSFDDCGEPITDDRFNLASPENCAPSRARTSPNRPPSIFAFRSPIRSLVTAPTIKKSPLPSLDISPPRASNFPERDVDSPLRDPSNVVKFANNLREPASDLREPASHLRGPAKNNLGLANNVNDVSTRKLSVSSQSSDDSGAVNNTLRILCAACNTYVQAYPVNLPESVLESISGARTEATVRSPVESGNFGEASTQTKPLMPTTSAEASRDAASKHEVDFLRNGLASAFSELLTTREHLNVVMNTTEKLELDVNMLRGGVNFVHVHVNSVLKRKELRIEETISGVPLLIMVRLRLIEKEPFLGFFIGLDKLRGQMHSPLKRIVTFRAHDSHGRVVEQHDLKTFENGDSVDPCFDSTKRSIQGSLWGYSQFLSKSQLHQAGMLNNGILTLSLQLDPLPEQ